MNAKLKRVFQANINTQKKSYMELHKFTFHMFTQPNNVSTTFSLQKMNFSDSYSMKTFFFVLMPLSIRSTQNVSDTLKGKSSYANEPYIVNGLVKIMLKKKSDFR